MIVATEHQDQTTLSADNKISAPNILEAIDFNSLERATKKPKTHHAILDNICKFDTENERILGTALMKAMNIKTATLTFATDSSNNEENEVDIDILSSQEDWRN